MNWPEKMLVEDFTPHPEYNQDDLIENYSLYAGGNQFKRERDRFLIPRDIEGVEPSTIANNSVGDTSGGIGATSGAPGSGYGRNRHVVGGRYNNNSRAHKNGQYINRVKPIIEYMIASICKKQVLVSGPGQYWNDINFNADGMGHSLTYIVKELIRDIMIYKKGYLAIRSPLNAPLDIEIYPMCPVVAEDWAFDDYELDWLRCHTSTLLRDEQKPFKWGDKQEHTQTIYTEDEKIVYVYLDGDKDAGIFNREPHNCSRNPIFPADVPDYMAVVDNIKDNAVALYNREVSLSFGLDKLAYPFLVATGQKGGLTDMNGNTVNMIVDATTGAIILRDGDMKYVSLAPNQLSGLSEEVQRQANMLSQTVQQASIQAVKQEVGQHNRATAQGRTLDQEPLQIMLGAYSEVPLQVLSDVVQTISEIRGDSNISIEGLDDFTARMEDLAKLVQVEDRDSHQRTDGNYDAPVRDTGGSYGMTRLPYGPTPQ